MYSMMCTGYHKGDRT